MSWTKIKSDGRGGYNVHDNWTSGDDSMDKVFLYFLYIPLVLLFCILLPVIFWLIAPLETDSKNRTNNYVGIGASVVFLLDYMTGGPLWCFFTHSGNDAALSFFGALHVGFLFINLILLYVMKNQIRLPLLVFYGGIIVVCVLGNNMLNSIGNNIKSDTPVSFMEKYHNQEMQDLADGL